MSQAVDTIQRVQHSGNCDKRHLSHLTFHTAKAFTPRTIRYILKGMTT